MLEVSVVKSLPDPYVIVLDELVVVALSLVVLLRVLREALLIIEVSLVFVVWKYSCVLVIQNS